MEIFYNLLCFLNLHKWFYYGGVIGEFKDIDLIIKHRKCDRCGRTMYRDLMPYKGSESKHWHLGELFPLNDKESLHYKRKNKIKKILNNG